MVNNKEWTERILEAIDDTEDVTTNLPRKSILRLSGKTNGITVQFTNSINTDIILNKVEEKFSEQTKFSINDNKVRIEFTKEPMLNNIYGKELITKILEQDIPERDRVIVDYKFYNDFVLIKSPIRNRIKLFPSLNTDFFVLTGIIKNGGIYHQKFRQNKRMKNNNRHKNIIEEYGVYRIRNISYDLTIDCPDCSGNISRTYNGEIYCWSCNRCSNMIDPNSLNLDEKINPLLDRKEIRDKIEDEIIKMV